MKFNVTEHIQETTQDYKELIMQNILEFAIQLERRVKNG